MSQDHGKGKKVKSSERIGRSEGPGSKSDTCRLCGGETSKRFELQLLGRHQVSYLRCSRCQSLETEAPYWLSEAYGDDVPAEDPFYLFRNLEVARHVKLMLHLFRVPKSANVLDFGGGLGVVARLIRESGWEAFVEDRFTDPPFPDISWSGKQADFVLASEVFEHLDQPAEQIGRIFALQPRYVYVRTSRYGGEGSDWFYLAPETGQHVFFYSDQAMRLIAAAITLPCPPAKMRCSPGSL